MKYPTFEEWLFEIENYGTRMERFYEECECGMSEERILQWLKAAWNCAREVTDE